ncbi:D-glycero-d-manno-heptose 1-phosphate guanosyltransferase [Caballeronia telluris]|uniref:D-glycero-d-manno-heptose 1-phosphate guanosyltransferase n=2 Tax=Caballeronia telluris TaxID=326475 RepID=A0A158GKU0_9BURK|nr:D-glycero-d-manno-heptose 1-phosphate guanosyltransferase [Caballeronia telluris]
MSDVLPCLILAGGLGTRLRPVLGDEMPKALASIGGRPFLSWMLHRLVQQGAPEIVLAIGHGQRHIRDFVASSRDGIEVSFVEEHEPLGTGGAIVHALRAHGAPDMIVMNGDTISNLDLRGLSAFHRSTKADLVIAATTVPDGSRYGTLAFDAQTRRLRAFHEKREGHGFINAGTYTLRAASVLACELPKRFSFEQDFLAKRVAAMDMRVFPDVTEFIDIGIPQDYARAQTVIPQMLEAYGREA